MTDLSPPRWLVVEEGARAGTSLLLEGRPVLIGRDPDADFRMDAEKDRLVSTQHALLGPSEGGWVVRDLESRNGTWVNGERVDGTRAVEPGDRIRLGRTGPLILFTDREPTLAGEAPIGSAPPTREARPAPLGGKRGALLVAGVGVAGLAAVLALWTAGGSADGSPSSSDGLEAAGSPTYREPAGGTATSPAPADAAGMDTAAARRDDVIAALRDSIRGLDDALRSAQRESRNLRAALEEAERSGASDEEVAELRRRLQASNAALRRQQFAASLDYESIGRSARPATAQVYVEFSGGRVIAATAFGVDPGGRLITNRHVVRGQGGRSVLRIGVQYSGRAELLPAEVVTVSPTDDLALIRVSGTAGPLPAVTEFNARPDTLAPGSPVVLFGFPLGGENGEAQRAPVPLVSAGVLVGGKDGLLEVEGYGRGGASGSPILDSKGKVIGVLMGGTIEEGGERVFAVPASRLIDFLRSAPRSR